MVYSCNDAMDDIAEVLKEEVCSTCAERPYCWNENEIVDMESLTTCVCHAIRHAVQDGF